MDAPPHNSQLAWQPLTVRGVAAFAHAPARRLLLVQLIFALLAAAAIVWFLQTAWFPTVRSAIAQLPPRGEIRHGRLDWRGPPATTLAENRFLALVVDLDHQSGLRSPAQLQLEFGRADFRLSSQLGLGYWQGSYPAHSFMAFNRSDLEPWWGAWAPMLLAMAALLVVAWLLFAWLILALVYALPVRLVGFFANRDLTWRGSRRLAGAALMPGALLMTAALVFYGLGLLDLVRLAVAAVLHLVIGWGYVIVCPLFLPRHPAIPAQSDNPFKKQ